MSKMHSSVACRQWFWCYIQHALHVAKPPTSQSHKLHPNVNILILQATALLSHLIEYTTDNLLKLCIYCSHQLCSTLGSFKLCQIEQSLREQSSSRIQYEQIDGSISSKFTIVCSLNQKTQFWSKPSIASSFFVIIDSKSIKIKCCRKLRSLFITLLQK